MATTSAHSLLAFGPSTSPPPLQIVPNAGELRVPLELADQILVVRLRLAPNQYPTRRTDAQAALLHTVLCVLGRVGPDKSYFERMMLKLFRWFNLDTMSAGGNVGGLDMMMRLHLMRLRPLEYTRDGMIRAARNGHINVLDLWYQQRQLGRLVFEDIEWRDIVDSPGALLGILVKHSDKRAAAQVLKWFLRVHKALDVDSMPYLVGRGHLEKPLFDEKWCDVGDVVTKCVRGGQLPTLREVVGKCWGGVFKFENGPKLFELAAEQSTTEELVEWMISFCSTPVKLEHLQALISGATRAGRVTVLDWCCTRFSSLLHSLSRLPADQIQSLLQVASNNGHLDVVQWWVARLGKNKLSSLKLKINLYTITFPLGHPDVIAFWKANAAHFGMALVFESDDWPNDLVDLLRAGLHDRAMVCLDSVLRLHPTKITRYKGRDFSRVLTAAARHKDGIRFLKSLKAVFDKLPGRPLVMLAPDAIKEATAKNCCEILEWWSARCKPGKAIVLDPKAVIAGARAGALDALKWWRSKCSVQFDSAIGNLTVETLHSGHLLVLEWLVDIRRARDQWRWRLPVDASTAPSLVPHLLDMHVGEDKVVVALGLFRSCFKSGAVVMMESLLAAMGPEFVARVKELCKEVGWKTPNMCVLDWLFFRYGFTFTGDSQAVHQILTDKQVYTLKWWVRTGMKLELSSLKHNRWMQNYLRKIASHPIVQVLEEYQMEESKRIH